MIYEKNMILKNYKNIDLRFGLCYPNTYNVAMSSLGYEILYNFINETPNVYCERIIYPNVKSIETNTPLKNFDIVSFSLQYEEDYFNVLEMLKKSDIPLKRKDRSLNDPLIIAGGPCATANPKPMSEFIDLFIIGEGESILNQVIQKYSKDKDLKKFLKIKGVYIPKYDNKTEISIVKDMNQAYHITQPIISQNCENGAFNNSIMLNVSRGCTRGCRFCMASYLYRPTRETELEKLIEIAESTRKNTNLNKITLIGAAVSDYSRINELISILQSKNFEISTPSLRLESINKEYLETLKKSGLKTITIAPESIAKIRKSINKEISDEKIFEIVKIAFDLGFNIKLYFIIGFPNETLEDIEELANFMKKIASFRNNNKVKFSVNPLIPKPHTPLQWMTFNLKDIKKKSRYLKKEMKNYNIKIESPKKSMIQYILSCGNSNVSQIIKESLTRKVSIKEWEEYLPNYSIDNKLPWHNIDTHINEKFLKNEYKRIITGKQTPWCETSNCYNCGACDNKNIEKRKNYDKSSK